jgi:hypothetical protein
MGLLKRGAVAVQSVLALAAQEPLVMAAGSQGSLVHLHLVNRRPLAASPLGDSLAAAAVPQRHHWMKSSWAKSQNLLADNC